jgi:hypothetical protein
MHHVSPLAIKIAAEAQQQVLPAYPGEERPPAPGRPWIRQQLFQAWQALADRIEAARIEVLLSMRRSTAGVARR